MQSNFDLMIENPPSRCVEGSRWTFKYQLVAVRRALADCGSDY